MMRFSGTIEELSLDIETAAIAAWIGGIPFKDWPQQKFRDPPQPAWITDPLFRGFGYHVAAFLDANLGLAFPGCDLASPMLSAILPGSFLGTHRDEQSPGWRFRLHIPLMTNPACFIVIDRPYHLCVGRAYKVNTEKGHAVVNHGDTPRIHLLFDVMESP